LPPGGYSMVSAGAGIAPNSGVGFDVLSAALNGGLVASGNDNLVPGSAAAQPPASDLAQAASQPSSTLGPVTLTSPMPSVLQPRRNQISPSDFQSCGLSRWVNANPLLAVGAAVGLYFLLRGKK
jgi:hypothetical protein